ncbi:DNA (cytosine-5)-methyltransferase 3B-like isoform X2 [Thrips palmi]|uniref:DNA (Cytosine-5)-methyltransferase 3B-like isoform X2 n=1 Tax=Thrips palmi TaxID=161013 RepID=A0A6P8YAC0_THRPL|nr:DNA (cytosine-5)-methyltransferase 3B-like isoform X2 [Thrips palmi]
MSDPRNAGVFSWDYIRDARPIFESSNTTVFSSECSSKHLLKMDLNSSGESWDLEDDTTGSDDSSNENESPDSSDSSPEKSKGRIKRRGRRRSASPIIPLSDPQEGDIVWAKVKNYRWWPAMVVNKEDCGKLAFTQRGIQSCHFVYWFGDERVSSIAMSNLVDFKKGFRRFITPRGSKSFRSGVYLAIKEIRKSLLLDTDDYDVTRALDWAENGFPLPKECCDIQINDTVSQHVQNKLKILRGKYEENEEEDDEDEPEDSTVEIVISAEEEDMIYSVREGTVNLDDICLACLSQENELREHPFFHGSICSPCMVKLLDYSFSIGLDMIAFHCSICMNSGEMMVCSQPFCYRAFCSKCIILKATLGVIDCIREADPWSCFMCTPFTSEMHGLLEPRSAVWKENMREAFHSGMTNIKKLKEISLRILCLDGSCNSDGEKESFGSKFFSFHNILSMLNILNQTCDQPQLPLMWIFEMAPAYWEDYVILISRYLQLDPAAWSEKANRSKDEHLVWTNIPAMWSFLEDATTLQKKYQPEARNKKLYRMENYD